MRTELETIDALLAHYASGLLPEPARVIVEAHLEIKAANRPLVSVFDEVGGDMLMTGAAGADQPARRAASTPSLPPNPCRCRPRDRR